MNEDNIFEYLSEEKKQSPAQKTPDIKKSLDDYHEFVEGLPEWDLEPPHEIVRRNQL